MTSSEVGLEPASLNGWMSVELYFQARPIVLSGAQCHEEKFHPDLIRDCNGGFQHEQVMPQKRGHLDKIKPSGKI